MFQLLVKAHAEGVTNPRCPAHIELAADAGSYLNSLYVLPPAICMWSMMRACLTDDLCNRQPMHSSNTSTPSASNRIQVTLSNNLRVGDMCCIDHYLPMSQKAITGGGIHRHIDFFPRKDDFSSSPALVLSNFGPSWPPYVPQKFTMVRRFSPCSNSWVVRARYIR